AIAHRTAGLYQRTARPGEPTRGVGLRGPDSPRDVRPGRRSPGLPGRASLRPRSAGDSLEGSPQAGEAPMYDAELDDFVPKTGPPPPPTSAPTRPSPDPIKVILTGLSLAWPVHRSAQVVFAEALRQGLVAGLPIDRAVGLAAGVCPGRRFREALSRMAR